MDQARLISLFTLHSSGRVSQSAWHEFTTEGWAKLQEFARDMRSHFPDCECHVLDNSMPPNRFDPIGDFPA